MSNICAVKGCNVQTKIDKISMFSFPKDRERCMYWAAAASCEHLLNQQGLISSSYYRICARHFENQMFLNNLKNRLQKNAKPTLYLEAKNAASTNLSTASTSSDGGSGDCNSNITTKTPQEMLSVNMTCDVETQTTKTPSTNEVKLQQKCLQLQKQLKSLETNTQAFRKNASVEDFKYLCEKMLPKNCAKFVKLQADLNTIKPKRKRYNMLFLELCLNLYFMGPKTYGALSTTFILPTETSLIRMIKSLQFSPGLVPDSFRVFFKKIKHFSPMDKYCMLCINEVPIKSNLFYNIGGDKVFGYHDLGEGTKFLPAENVLVLTLKGIHSNWKQTLGYFLVHGKCKMVNLFMLMETCVSQLEFMHVQVKVLTTDMSHTGLRLKRFMGISLKEPYFTAEYDKTYYMFDALRLMKATRNILLKYTLRWGRKKTSWAYIKELYNIEQVSSKKLAPNLTESHVNPTNLEKKKVSLAVQVLNKSVATAMSTYIAKKALKPEAAATAEFIEKFDKLFNIFNSNDTESAFKGNENQLNFLKEMLTFLNNIKIFDKNGKDISSTIKTIKCWQLNIKSLLQLWDELKISGFQFLSTHRLNLEDLESVFGLIHQWGGNAVNPTPIQFHRAFKKLFIDDLLHSGIEHCTEDMTGILNTVTTELQNQEPYDAKDVRPRKEIIALHDYDYRFHDIEQNSLSHICRYLLQKCLEVHFCDICETYVTDHEDMKETTILTNFKEYQHRNRSNFGRLYMPTSNFFYHICELEQIFNDNFESIALKWGIAKKIIKISNRSTLQHPCEDFPYDYLLKLYARIKLFYTLKFININFKAQRAIRARKKVMIWKRT